jgi:hypothetical protein
VYMPMIEGSGPILTAHPSLSFEKVHDRRKRS